MFKNVSAKGKGTGPRDRQGSLPIPVIFEGSTPAKGFHEPPYVPPQIGYIYHDGPSIENTIGQCGMGPSQVLPRMQRYRIKKKALIPKQDVPAHPEYQQGFQKEVDMQKSLAK